MIGGLLGNQAGIPSSILDERTTLRPVSGSDRLPDPGIPLFMKKAYTIKEAQRNLAAMVRTAELGELTTITRHNHPVVCVIGAERMGAIAETIEILANPDAMRAIRAADSGKGKSMPAEDLPE